VHLVLRSSMQAKICAVLKLKYEVQLKRIEFRIDNITPLTNDVDVRHVSCSCCMPIAQKNQDALIL